MPDWRDLSVVVALANTFCPAGPIRQGALGPVADSLLSRGAQQTCVTVPINPNAVYETGYVQCWAEPDSGVMIKGSIDGVVQYVTVAQPWSASYSTEARLRVSLGVPGRACEYGPDYASIGWRTGGYDIEVVRLPDSTAYVNYTLVRDSTWVIDCYLHVVH